MALALAGPPLSAQGFNPSKSSKSSGAATPPDRSRAGAAPPLAPGPAPAATAPGAEAPKATGEKAEPAKEPRRKGVVGAIVGFIREYATWIIILLGAAILGVVAWAVLGGRARGAAEPPEELDTRKEARPGKKTRFSSTKIQAAQVAARVGRGVETTEVETDREYALVVDEEALKMPPLPEEIDGHTGKQYAEASEIKKCLEENRYDDAFDEYVRRVEEDGTLEFQAQIEESLSEHFIRSRELEKAARILEHHVATHASKDISSQTYFNLGYIHFVNKTPNKSRRFLKLFVEKEKNPAYRARAEKILAQMGTMG
jgi:hypothetical protein